MRKLIAGLSLTSALVVSGFWFVGCGPQNPYTSGGRTAAKWGEVLRQPDVEARRKAAVKIGPLLLSDPAAMPVALDALKDTDTKVRLSAIRSLRIYAGRKAQEAVVALREVELQ